MTTVYIVVEHEEEYGPITDIVSVWRNRSDAERECQERHNRHDLYHLYNPEIIEMILH